MAARGYEIFVRVLKNISECLECNNLYLTTIRVFKVMLIYCPNLKSDLKVTLIKASVILHI